MAFGRKSETLMAYELIPGVRQNHRGKTYQIGRYPNGKLIDVPVDPAPLSARTEAALEPVMVQSRSLLSLNANKKEDERKNEPHVEAGLLTRSWYQRGEEFQSMQCFQGRQG